MMENGMMIKTRKRIMTYKNKDVYEGEWNDDKNMEKEN